MDYVCRICLKPTTNVNNLFDDDIPHKIQTISSVEVTTTDKLPPNVCSFCKQNVNLLYNFRNEIIKSHHILLKRLQERCNVEEKIKQEEIEDDVDDSIGDNYYDDIDNDIAKDIEKIELKIPPEENALEEKPFNEQNDAGSSSENYTLSQLLTKSTSNSKLHKVHRCPSCDFETQFIDDLKSHKKQHLGPPRTLCNVCGKSITSYNFSKHLLTHTDTAVTCDICGKVLKNGESFRGHRRVHKNTKFECKFCNKVYSNRQAVKNHLRRHTLEDARIFGCSVCKKRFFDNQTLKKHLRTHTGERPYPCQYCKKGFSSSNALKTHTRQHTNEKPYACIYCDSAFHQKVSLSTHIKSKHITKLVNINENNAESL